MSIKNGVNERSIPRVGVPINKVRDIEIGERGDGRVGKGFVT
jgi:hypothetical protein